MSAILKSEIIENLRTQIANDAYILYETVSLCLDDNQDTVAVSEAMTEAVQYLDNIAEQAKQANFEGLKDICGLIQSNLIALQNQDKSQQEIVCRYIEQLPRLVSNYLYAPTNKSSRQHLIHHLQTAQWVSTQEAKALSALLAQNAETVTVEADTNALSEHDAKRETTDMSDVLNEFTEEVVELSEDIDDKQTLRAALEENSHLEDANLADELLLDDDILDDLPADFAQAELDEQKVPNADIAQPLYSEHRSEQIIELSNQIVEMSTVLTEALNRFATENNESEIFLEGVERYTNTVQNLWELSEQEGLHALQEICTFINDNVFEMSVLDATTRISVHELFAAWPQLVLDYLQAPQEGARLLVTHLKNPLWAIRLSNEKAENLIKQLIQEIYVPVSHANYGRYAAPTQQAAYTTVASRHEEKTVVAEDIQSTVEIVDNAQLEDISIAEETLEVSDSDIEADNTLSELETLSEIGEQTAEEALEEVTLSEDETLLLEDLPSLDEEGEIEISDELSADIGELEALEDLLPLDDTVDTEIAEELQAEADTTEIIDLLPAPETADALEMLEAETEPSEILDDLPTLDETANTEISDKLQTDVDTLAVLEAETELEDLADDNLDAVENLASELPEEQTDTDDLVLEALSNDELVGTESEITTDLVAEQALIDEETFDLEATDEVSELAEEAILPESLPEDEIAVEDLENSEILAENDFMEEVIPEELSETRDVIKNDVSELEDTQINILAASEALENDADIISEQEEILSTEESPIVPIDTLDILNAELADAMTEMSSALQKFVHAEDDSPELLEAVEQYTDNIHSIADAVSMAGLSGLQDVCGFVNDNIFELSTQARAIRRTAQPHIETWPQLALTYLQLPSQGAQALIKHLSSTIWPFPLDEEKIEALFLKLTQPSVEQQENNENILLSSEEIFDETPVANIHLASDDVLDIVVGQLAETSQELTSTLHQLVEAEDGSEALLMAVENYTEQVQAIWDVAEMSQLVGLQDICTFINDNIMMLSAHPQPTRQHAKDVLATWIPLTITYLKTPTVGSIELLGHLQSSAWPQPLDDSQRPDWQQRLLEMAHADDNVQAQSVEPMAEITLASQDILDLLIGQIVDTETELTDSLTRLVEVDDGSEVLLTEVETYTENVQSIWDIAEMAKLAGLQDICTFINDNVMILSAQNKSVRGMAQTVFNRWTQLVVAYLQTPVAEVDNLLHYLQGSIWLQPLEPEQVTELRQKLLTAQEIETTEVVAPVSPVESDDIEETIVLADPDVLELIIAQMTDTEVELTTSLARLLSADDGSENLLMEVETYTENVQAIWDAADMASLSGLQEVCTFANDNVTILCTQDKATRSSAQDIFIRWPQLAIDYLKHPTSGAKALIAHLQVANWPNPLDSAQAVSLKQNLIPGQETASEPEIHLADPDILELVRNQITDLAESMSAALEECVTMDNDNPAFLEAIENYTNQVQAIWDAAEMAGLAGLQEVCTFVNDNVMALSAQDKAAKLEAQSHFEQWPAVVLEYLQSPATGSKNLVTLLQASGWPTPLEISRVNDLQALLTQSSTSPEQVAAYEQEITAAEPVIAAAPPPPAEAVEPLHEMGEVGEISLGSAEVLEILTSELESSKEDLTTELQKFTTLDKADANFGESAENYGDIVQRLYAAADMLGLEGLKEVCSLVVENVNGLATKDLAARSAAKGVLEAWPDLVLAYLNSPMESVVKMLNHFREPQWAMPLNDDKAHELLGLLTQGSTAEEDIDEAGAYARQSVATPEDVDINPPDVNPELYEAYLQETPQHAADFSQCIQNIIADPQIADIEKAQRIAHTLKGSSNIIGIKGIANIGHHLEDTLEYLAKHQVTPPKELTDTMVEAADCLEMMVDALTGQGDPPDNAQQVLQSVLDWANRIDKGNLDAPAAPRPAASTPVVADSGETKAESAKPAAQPKKEGGSAPAAPEQMLRVPTRTVDELMRLVGELSISLGQIQERFKHVVGSTRLLNEQDLILQQKTFELENLVDVRGITGMVSTDRSAAIEEEEEFDALEFEEYNELHSVAHSFIESIADNRELAISIRQDLSDLEGMIIQQERLGKEFQETIMTTRMVPVSTIVSKLQRNIRQTCRSTKKQAELEMVGTDIMIDSDVLSNLGDPLQHILRNSVDHGLETPDEREMLGKSSAGTITLHFYREGNNIVVACKDDGQGLNYTNIRYTAIQRGLLTESQEVTEQELARMILMSGFSTKSGVTQVSGRGVGMDVVHSNIREMKGTLDILSETGKGTTMLIKLPMTLVTVHVLIARVGTLRFGIPTSNLEQVLAPGSMEFQQVGDEINLKMGKNLYAIKPLSNLLSIPADKEGLENYEMRPIVLVHEETGMTAVLVDELIDTHDLVMKPMGRYVKNVHGVSGASILGDGSLVPLLDLPQLLRSPMQVAMSSYATQMNDEGMAATGPSVPKIMIVDDSLSVRKSLSLLIEDSGFDTLLAKDGLEAVELMSETKPDIALVDMEMPRMNGLELTAHIRSNAATSKLPVFMITSRTTEKHREQAKTAGVSAYLTKPYQDTELLDLIDKGLAGQI